MRSTLSVLFAFLLMLPAARAADPTAQARERMVRQIERIADYTPLESGNGQIDPRVLGIMRTIPRHQFVPLPMKPFAYDDRPLPIGYGQTISQPYIVALMTHLLGVDGDDVVLEVGTGSGYQAAVLSRIVKRVETVEIVAPLAKEAALRLEKLGYQNVAVHHADGYNGWKSAAPFDAIIVTAADTHIPPPLVQQLKPGGRMIIPVGGPFATQWLVLVEKSASGKVKTRQVLPVAFVPLTRMK